MLEIKCNQENQEIVFNGSATRILLELVQVSTQILNELADTQQEKQELYKIFIDSIQDNS